MNTYVREVIKSDKNIRDLYYTNKIFHDILEDSPDTSDPYLLTKDFVNKLSGLATGYTDILKIINECCDIETVLRIVKKVDKLA